MADIFNQGTCHMLTVFFDGFPGLKQRSFNGGIFNQGTCLQSFLDNFFAHHDFTRFFFKFFDCCLFLRFWRKLSMDVKFASVWFEFLPVDGWVIKIDANLALIICKRQSCATPTWVIRVDQRVQRVFAKKKKDLFP